MVEHRNNSTEGRRRGLSPSRLPALAMVALSVCGGWLAAQSGVSVDKVYAPVRDEQDRPITAGGFVTGAPHVFEDITAKSGLAAFRHRSGSQSKDHILDTPSGGVALLDYDRDGWLDIYLVNGSTVEAMRGSESAPKAALFHNNRDGTFSNATEKAGVANLGWGFGAVVGDYDQDGWPDLYVTNYGPNRLYRNNGDGTFTDMAVKAGVRVGTWSTAASFGDYDRDGHLDLFVSGYIDYDLDRPPDPEHLGIGKNFCEYRGKPVMCGPRGLKGARDFLFRNNGDGTFTEVAARAGVEDSVGYYGFAAAFLDLDDDGWLDLAVANDSTPNYLYRNKHDGTFEDISYPAGFALNEYGREQAGMGLAAGDYDNDGRIDLYVTHFSDDYNTLYRNEGEGFFMDLTFQLGLGEATIPFLGWGTAFLDYDNDGFRDLFVANGHAYPAVDQYDWGTTWSQRPLLFHNLEGRRFELSPAANGSGLAVVAPSRGAAVGDLDNDGLVDVVINCIDSHPLLLKNVTASPGHWISFSLEGAAPSPRDAIGAKIVLKTPGGTLRGDVVSGGSYASQSDLRVHFGLGSNLKILAVEVDWPSGQHQTLKDVSVDRVVRLKEPNPAKESP